MSQEDDDIAVLLQGVNATELGLAKSLMSEAGIPCMEHGPDFDVAELGVAAHQVLRGGDLLVPRSALEQARAVLEAAWGPRSDQDAESDAAPM